MQDRDLGQNKAEGRDQGFIKHLKELGGTLNKVKEDLTLNVEMDRLPDSTLIKLKDLESITIKDNHQFLASIIQYQLPKVLKELIDQDKIPDIPREELKLIYNVLTNKNYTLDKKSEIKLGPQESGALLERWDKDNPLYDLKQLLPLMDINTHDPQGNSLLHYAAYAGLVGETTELLAAIPVNIENKDGATPFHYACTTGNIDIINLLLEAGANDKQKLGDKTPLTLAQESNNSAVVTLLNHYQLASKITEELSPNLASLIKPEIGSNINHNNSTTPKPTPNKRARLSSHGK